MVLNVRFDSANVCAINLSLPKPSGVPISGQPILGMPQGICFLRDPAPLMICLWNVAFKMS